MTNVNLSTEEKKPANPPASPQQTQGNPPKPAEKPAEQQK
jgi:hypothetical protein